MLFDKTGTLTRGILQLSSVEVLAPGRADRPRCLALAAALESGSEHLVARALAAHASRTHPQGRRSHRTARAGMEGEIDGQRYRVGNPRYVAAMSAVDVPEVEGSDATPGPARRREGILARFQLRDELRADADVAIRACVNSASRSRS